MRLVDITGGDPEGLVLQSPEGLPIRATLFRRRFWAPAVTRAGLEPLRIHDPRLTAVAIWIASGPNPEAGRRARRPHIGLRRAGSLTGISTRRMMSHRWTISTTCCATSAADLL